MKHFLVLFREPDGRTDVHSEEMIHKHQQKWKAWLAHWGKEGNLKGGNSLTLNGKMLKGNPPESTDKIHQVGLEIVGGFLLVDADNLEQATAIVESCPIFEFDGYAEIREMQ